MSRRTGMACVVLSLLAVLCIWHVVMNGEEKVFYQHESCAPEDPSHTGFGRDGVLSTHLPLMIIETGGENIPGQDRDDRRELLCRYRIVDEDDGVNRSDSEAAEQGSLIISIRGNSSRALRKKQYSVKLVDEHGSNRPDSIMGMPEGTSWVLNGSLIDDSLMRNYIAYNVSNEVMGTAPECRMCELMMTDSGGDAEYEGFYILSERPGVGKERVSLTRYDPGHRETSFMLQQTFRIKENIIEHIAIEDAWPEPYEIIYPDPDIIEPEAEDYIQSEIYRIEKIIKDASHSGEWKKVRRSLTIRALPTTS